MNARMPEITILLDFAGLGLTLWLGLHLLTNGWGWLRGRAWQSALAFWGLALLFGLAVWDDLSPMAGFNPSFSMRRLALLPFPVLWAALTWALTPATARPRVRLVLPLVILAALTTAALTLYMGPLQPALLGQSWYLVPAYGITLLLGMGGTVVLAFAAQGTLRGELEQQAVGTLAAVAPFGLMAALLLAADLVWGLHQPPVPPLITTLHEPVRLAVSGTLFLTSLGLLLAVRQQAKADGALHRSTLPHAFLSLLLVLGIFLLLGGGAVWYWNLPLEVAGLFLLLALLAEPLVQGARQRMVGVVYRGEAGKFRHTLHHVEERVERLDGLPPGIRPILSHLARQLNSTQLGLALWNNREFRIMVALHRSWEGQSVDVGNLDVWQERGLHGWNMPLKGPNHQTLGVLASGHTGPLSSAQVQLLEEAAADIVALLAEWQALAQRRELLAKELDIYRQQEAAFAKRSLALAAPNATRGDLTREVQQLFERFRDPVAMGNHSLARMKFMDRVLPSARGAAVGRGEAMQEILMTMVEQLRPLGDLPTQPTPEWFPYLVTRRVYLEAEPVEAVMETLNLSRKTFQQARHAAMERLAHTLAEVEAGAVRQLSIAPPDGKPQVGGGFAAPTRPTATTPNAGWGGSTPNAAGTTGGEGRGSSWSAPASPQQGAARPSAQQGTLGGEGARPAQGGSTLPQQGKPASSGGLSNRIQGGADRPPFPPPPAAAAAPVPVEKKGALSDLTSRFQRGNNPPADPTSAKKGDKGPAAASPSNAVSGAVSGLTSRLGGMTSRLGKKKEPDAGVPPVPPAPPTTGDHARVIAAVDRDNAPPSRTQPVPKPSERERQQAADPEDTRRKPQGKR